MNTDIETICLQFFSFTIPKVMGIMKDRILIAGGNARWLMHRFYYIILTIRSGFG